MAALRAAPADKAARAGRVAPQLDAAARASEALGAARARLAGSK